FPAREGRNQPSQTENVIQMAVREQDTIQPLETDTAPQDLPLRAFATVHQKAVLARQNGLRCQPAMDRGRGSGGSKKDNFKHRHSFQLLVIMISGRKTRVPRCSSPSKTGRRVSVLSSYAPIDT